jgi:hypothetical protein
VWIGLVRDFGPDFGESIPRPDPHVVLYGGSDVALPARASCQRDRGHAPADFDSDGRRPRPAAGGAAAGKARQHAPAGDQRALLVSLACLESETAQL